MAKLEVCRCRRIKTRQKRVLRLFVDLGRCQASETPEQSGLGKASTGQAHGAHRFRSRTRGVSGLPHGRGHHGEALRNHLRQNPSLAEEPEPPVVRAFERHLRAHLKLPPNDCPRGRPQVRDLVPVNAGTALPAHASRDQAPAPETASAPACLKCIPFGEKGSDRCKNRREVPQFEPP
jgi:hypothetical protein